MRNRPHTQQPTRSDGSLMCYQLPTMARSNTVESSAKMMDPDLGIQMQTDPSYAEDLLGFKFKPAKGCVEDAAKSVVRLGLA